MPRVKFITSKELEKQNLEYFFKRSQDKGIDYFKTAMGNYPDLIELWKTSDLDKMKQWVDTRYDELDEELQKDLKSQEVIWRKIEDKFFQEAPKWFDGHPWPRQEFTACITIFSRFRYEKKEGRFYIPPKNIRHSVTGVAMHEMLHFLFFDFWNKHFKGQLNDDKLWDLSEVLNPLIMLNEPFLRWAGQRSRPYKQHEELFNLLESQFKNRESMVDFISDAILQVH